jgi:hypothetical protein
MNALATLSFRNRAFSGNFIMDLLKRVPITEEKNIIG